jgi:YVTN family beta-propeller protein
MGDPKNEMKGALSVLDTTTGKMRARITVPGYPFGVAAITTGPFADRKVYVTSEQRGTVSAVDVREGRALRDVPTGANATALLLNRKQDRLFVANSGSDTVSILKTDSDTIEKTILLRPADARGLPSATPLGMALSPDEKTLYVALGDLNAVAVVDVGRGSVRGYIPVGWYPTAVALSPDGARLFVANAKGVNVRNPNDKPAEVAGDGSRARYIQNIIEGTVSTIVLDGVDLRNETARVVANNRIQRDLVKVAQRALKNPGIEHVIYIIKENRTYDQVLSDLPVGNGDKSLLMFGRDVTPNQHALAERFVLLDNFYCCAEVSGDGWNWSTQGIANEYNARNVVYGYTGKNRTYDYEGTNNGVRVAPGLVPELRFLCRRRNAPRTGGGRYLSRRKGRGEQKGAGQKDLPGFPTV